MPTFPPFKVWSPAHNTHFYGGRRRMTTLPGAYFHEFLTRKALPAPPDSVDWSVKAAASISDVMLNDQLGDCVIAAMGHALGTFTGNAGTLIIPTTAQIKGEYAQCGPGDNGCDVQQELGNWVSGNFVGVPGSELLGFTGVNAADQTLCMQLVELLGGLDIGFEMPSEWLNPMPQSSGFTWDVAGAPNPGYGHSVWVVGYNSTGVKICTWGMTGTVTWAALAKYCVAANGGELYVLCSPQWMIAAQNTAPNGVAWNDLISYFDSVGGNVPVPAPVTPPVPTPTPTPPPVPAPPGPTPPAPSGSFILTGTFTGTITQA